MEKLGNQNEKLLNAEISNLIGRRLHDFDVMGSEVSTIIRAITGGWFSQGGRRGLVFLGGSQGVGFPREITGGWFS